MRSWCVRAQEQGQVTAVFDLPPKHPARALLREQGIDPDEDLILRRVQTADGKTRAFVNDQPVIGAGAEKPRRHAGRNSRPA